MFHVALKQTSFDLSGALEIFYGADDLSIHYFKTYKELLRISQRFLLDVILIAGKGEFLEEIELTQRIKENTFTSILPTAMYHPDPPDSDVISAYESGCDDFLMGPWQEKLFEVRLKMLTRRSQRDISINPSSMLPGPTMIEREIDRQIALKQEFAVCYSDLDNFKAYNDCYGYYYGDKIIRLTSRIIRDTVFDMCPEGFVGHVGGDDFVYIIPADMVRPICDVVVKVFDTLIQYRYYPRDRQRKYIITTNRRGEVERFNILTLSIAVLINADQQFAHAGEMSRMLADLKKFAKSQPGSNYVIERRSKY